MIALTVSSSRLNARPKTLLPKSSSSEARQAASPWMRAMPSPISTTVPTSTDSDRPSNFWICALMTSEITDIIKAQIQKFEGRSESVDVGTVVEIGDGIARIHGLAACLASELLDFGNNVFGLAFNLEEDTVSAIILGDYTGIEEGGEVRTTGRIVETAVGQQLVGRVVDPLSRPLDGKGPIDTKEFRPVDVVAPGEMMG